MSVTYTGTYFSKVVYPNFVGLMETKTHYNFDYLGGLLKIDVWLVYEEFESKKEHIILKSQSGFIITEPKNTTEQDLFNAAVKACAELKSFRIRGDADIANLLSPIPLPGPFEVGKPVSEVYAYFQRL